MHTRPGRTALALTAPLAFLLLAACASDGDFYGTEPSRVNAEGTPECRQPAKASAQRKSGTYARQVQDACEDAQ